MSRGATIPVHILTGFLGSGKTTLLNRALSAAFGAETAVVVNEFGDIGLDQLFIQARSEETIVLKSGCVCCSIRTDLVSTLMQLAAMRDGSSRPFRRILIETSGISDPLPILQTLQSDFNLRTRFRIGSVVCTVDASNAARAHGGPEVLAQLIAADACVTTKLDLVDAKTARAVGASIGALNPLAEIVPGEGAALVDWLERQEDRGHDLVRNVFLAQAGASAQDRPHAIRSTVLRAAAPQSWSRFAVWLTRLVFLHGDRILRIKGLLFDPERQVWIGVHGVRRFFHPPVHLTLPSPPPCGACLVFITDRLDPVRIEDSYRRLVEPEGMQADRVSHQAMPAEMHEALTS